MTTTLENGKYFLGKRLLIPFQYLQINQLSLQTKSLNKGVEYSAVNTKRLTLSFALIMDHGISFGKQLLV